MRITRSLVMAFAILALGACSSRPREFAPVLQQPAADAAKYQADYETCRKWVAEGQRSGFGARMASGAVGAAAGVGVGAAMAGGTYGTMAGAMAAASATLVLMPVVGVAAAWGVAKRNKLKKEKEVKDAMALCLSEAGYTISGWEVEKKRKKGAAAAPAA